MNLKLLKVARFFHLINKKNYNEKRQIEIVKNSPLFDAKWYLAQNPDVKAKKIGAAKHYVKYGWKEGRNPSPDFDGNAYLNTYPDIRNICPLVHYEICGKKENRNKFSNDNIIGNQIFLPKYEPLVSVIVPNYNHGQFLKKRLDSIYSQSYGNFEVILLDDCSTDNSREILMFYQKKYSTNTTILFNSENSGGVFNQWKKGIAIAKGEFIWIAESDDYCSNNFLSSVIPAFEDESVMISFCRSIFVKNGKQVWTQEEYLHDIPYNWHKSFTETAHNLVNKGFGFKNIIPNVSSAVFRNTGFETIINNMQWYKLKLCGDWIFYLDLIKGGKLAYTSSAQNFYRLHDHNTSSDIQKEEIYYEEHQLVSMYIAQNYRVENAIFNKQREILKNHWQTTRNYFSEEKLDKLYNIEKINKMCLLRKPNILMCIFAFSSGGGETFPIFLSNQLRKDGVNITLLDCEGQLHEKGIRNMLLPNIPVLHLGQNKIIEIIKNYGIDIVQSQHASIDLLISQQKNKFSSNCSHLVVLHGMYETIPDKYLQQQLPIITKSANRFLYIADKNLLSFKKFDMYNPSIFFKISNGLPQYEVEKITRQSLQIPDDAFVLCIVSRGILEKGWIESVEAVKIARKKTKKNIHLILVGDGKAYDILKDNVPNYVHLVGFQKNTRAYFKISDIGLLPSRFKGESFPLVIIDALFCDIPVIASNIGETKNMLTTEQGEIAGSIFDLQNGEIPIKKLAKIISGYASNMKQYMQKKENVYKIKNKYDIKEVAKNYMSHYTDIIKNNILNKNNSLNKERRAIFAGSMTSQNFEPILLKEKEYANKVGLNTGNCIMGDYARRPLSYKIIKESGFPFWDIDIDEANEYSNIIVFATNWLRYMPHDFSAINQKIKQIKTPITIIGLGSHTPYDNYDDDEFIKGLNPTLVEFLRLVSEKNHSISVRGYTTERLLKKLGILNISVTGCPTWYVNGFNNKEIVKKELTNDSRILFHADPEKKPIYNILLEKLKKYKNNQLLIQSEFDLLKYIDPLDAIADNYNNRFNLPETFLKQKKMVCFTNVDKWEEYLQQIDLSFGLRIHGTIISLKSGVPAIIVAHDGRTREMAEFFSIPHISVSDLCTNNLTIEKIYEKADFSKINREYHKLLKNYIDFLNKNGISHGFEQ